MANSFALGPGGLRPFLRGAPSASQAPRSLIRTGLVVALAAALKVALFAKPHAARAEGEPQPVGGQPAAAATAGGEAAETSRDAWLQQTQRQLDAARAATANMTREEIAAYCEHTAAAHRSEAAQLRSPWLAARGTTLQRGELGAGQRDVTPRFRVGLGFSLTDWWRAGLVEERAQSACAMYEAQTQLRPPAADVEALSLDGWKQKVALLNSALSQAKALLDRSDAALSRGDRTIVEHLAVLGDYQTLEQELARAEVEVSRLTLVNTPVTQSPESLDALRASVANMERVEGALRRNKTLAVDLEGGYDEIIGTAQRLPVYGQVNLTFRPGYFWQGSADATSETARARAATLAAMGAQAHFRELVVGVSARRGPMANEVARLRELVALLQQKYDALVVLTRPDAQYVAERLWFKLQVSRAEMAHLEAALAAMDGWLAKVR